MNEIIQFADSIDIGNTVIAERWRLVKKIGYGGCGVVFEAQHINTKDMVAVKMERKSEEAVPRLRKEYHICNHLQSPERHFTGTPDVYCFDPTNEFFDAMVMLRLGSSLKGHLLRSFQNGFRGLSLKSVLMIGILQLSILEYIHDKGFLHGDIKPENILTAHDNRGVLYLIDFGLARRYQDLSTGEHEEHYAVVEFGGTPLYASIRTMQLQAQFRRVDLESPGYVLLFLLDGRLPWSRVMRGDLTRMMQNILKMKEDMTLRELCAGKPEEFRDYLHSVRGLRFDERPDYDYLRKLFESVMERYRLANDRIFDWMV